MQALDGKVGDYWTTLDDEAAQPLADYMSRIRFEQISRYIKISNPDDEDDLDDSEWFTKTEPLAPSSKPSPKVRKILRGHGKIKSCEDEIYETTEIFFIPIRYVEARSRHIR